MSSKNEQIVANLSDLDKLGFNDLKPDSSTPPVGLREATAAQVTGATIFDTIEDLSSVGQVVALKALANSAMYVAIHNAWDKLDQNPRNNETAADILNRQERATQRLAVNMAVYNYCKEQITPFIESEYDEVQTPESSLQFVLSNTTPPKAKDISDELLEAYGIDRSEYNLVAAEHAIRKAERAAWVRKEIGDKSAAILAEIDGLVDNDTCYESVHDNFTPEMHVAAYRKVLEKLKARTTRTLFQSMEFNGDLADRLRSDAGMLSMDRKVVDKAYIAFARANAAELRQAA